MLLPLTSADADALARMVDQDELVKVEGSHPDQMGVGATMGLDGQIDNLEGWKHFHHKKMPWEVDSSTDSTGLLGVSDLTGSLNLRMGKQVMGTRLAHKEADMKGSFRPPWAARQRSGLEKDISKRSRHHQDQPSIQFFRSWTTQMKREATMRVLFGKSSNPPSCCPDVIPIDDTPPFANQGPLSRTGASKGTKRTPKQRKVPRRKRTPRNSSIPRTLEQLETHITSREFSPKSTTFPHSNLFALNGDISPVAKTDMAVVPPTPSDSTLPRADIKDCEARDLESMLFDQFLTLKFPARYTGTRPSLDECEPIDGVEW